MHFFSAVVALGVLLPPQPPGQFPYRTVVLAGEYDCRGLTVNFLKGPLAGSGYESVDRAIASLGERGFSQPKLKVVFGHIQESCKLDRQPAGNPASSGGQITSSDSGQLLLEIDLVKTVARFTLGDVDAVILKDPQKFVEAKLAKKCDRISPQCLKCNGKIVCNTPDPR